MPIFAESPSDRSFERVMTAIPNFRPKGHGTYIFGRKELAPEIYDCGLCLYNKGKTKTCLLKRCPYIKERIFSGIASTKEILMELAAEVNVSSFQKRVERSIKERESEPMDFRNEKHQIAFTEKITLSCLPYIC